MQITKIDSGLLHSCMYIVREGDHAIVIDPCKNTEAVKDVSVDYLIVTHEHYDHISGVNEMKTLKGAPLLCSKACAEKIKSSRKNLSRYFDAFCAMQTWVEIDPNQSYSEDYSCTADITFEKEKSFEWQGHRITLIEIPGHSQGSIGIWIDDSDFFSGDSLMENCEVELRFPGGSVKDWEEVGKKIIDAIPEGTNIWPGHFEGFIYRKKQIEG